MANCDAEVAHRPPDRGGTFRIVGWAECLEAPDQLLDLVGILFEMVGARGGDLERLASALARSFLDQAHFHEHRQRRIDHPGARRVGAAGQFFDRANQVVAVPRLLGDQLEQDESQLSRFKHAAGAAAAASAPAPRSTLIADVETERPPIAVPAAAAAHCEQAFRKADGETAAMTAFMVSMSHGYSPF